MMKYTFIMLLIVHVLGDFYFQTDKMAQNKKENFKWVVGHSLIYAMISFVMIYIFVPGIPKEVAFVFVISHGFIDIVKYVICNHKYLKKKGVLIEHKTVFIVDQMIHIFVILTITYYLSEYQLENLYNSHIKSIFSLFGLSGSFTLSWIIKILLMHKPANILIANILEKYKPYEKLSNDINSKSAGRFIGTLERIIMTIFITINQYSAVGLVLTAKSIARYNKISDDPEFAEYYLLGTLLSTLCAISVSIIF